MISILKDDDIVVDDEYTLYLYLDFWIDCQKSKFSADDPEFEEKMFQIVQQSIELIRFPMMAPRQLADMLLSPLTQKYKEFLMEKMAIGMAFHSGTYSRLTLLNIYFSGFQVRFISDEAANFINLLNLTFFIGSRHC